eukprot:CAMPEP_0119131692 /NCGR_PEP_ID=MMETSP1310-20130426/10524_1 /TAXON_ID=464262 /ORGANISM="Genus nov. species nov., Strain RCC2339" /LENGTH=391 /DNA_ID=CAMNT_0007122283 /DNA_START=43 /DNA_END=1214 /DNA_ORIENTATION=-
MAKQPPAGIWQETGPWKVYVEVLGGRDIVDNKSPYVKLALGSTEYKTKQVSKSIVPAWYQEFEFDLSNSQQQLHCQLYDHRKFGSDSLLGEIAIPLGMVVDGIEKDEWFDLVRTRSGKIHLKILAEGPNAEKNRQEKGAPTPSIGPAKRGAKHNYQAKKYNDSKQCKFCQSALKGMFAKSFECTVCQTGACNSCYTSPDLKVQYGCKDPKAATPQMSAKMGQSVMNFYMNYTGRDKDGKLVVKNLPQEWKELFKAAGVKPRELKNPDTVIMLLTAMDKHKETEGAGGVAPVAVGGGAPAPPAANDGPEVICRAKVNYDYPAQQEGDLSISVGQTVDVHEKLDNGWWHGTVNGASGFFPGSYCEELPPEPKVVAPPPPPVRDDDPAPPPTPA